MEYCKCELRARSSLLILHYVAEDYGSISLPFLKSESNSALRCLIFSFRSAFFSAEVAALKSVNWRLLLPSAHVQRERPLQNLSLLFIQRERENQSKERELLSSISSLTGMWHPVGRGGTSPWASEDGCCLTQVCLLLGSALWLSSVVRCDTSEVTEVLRDCCCS